MKHKVWTSEGGVQVDLPHVNADNPHEALRLAVAAFRADLPSVRDYCDEGDEAQETINVDDGDGCLSATVCWSEDDRA